MKSSRLNLAVLSLVILASAESSARDWVDASGKHKFQGELISASEHTVLVRQIGGELASYTVEELSAADRDYVAQHLTKTDDPAAPEKMQTWTGREGMQFRARVVGYGTQPVNLRYDRSRVRVNNKPLDEIDQLYQMMIPKIVAEYDDKSVVSDEDLTRWARKLRGKDRTFTVDGVLMRLENGEKVAVPLFLFSADERSVLEEGWDSWKAETTKEDERKRDSFLAQAAAEEYQRNRDAETKTNQQIQIMQLGLMAVNAGITNVWQVQMNPRPGIRARQTYAIVPAKTSAEATALAAQKYPAFIPGAVRQMNY